MPVKGTKISSKWTPKNSSQFVIDYLAGYNDTELATRHSTTADCVKKYLTRLRKDEGLPPRKDLDQWQGGFELKHDRERQQFVDFLQKSRTKAQIVTKFGAEMAEEFLGAEYTGFHLFQQLNDYNQTVYILLPIISREVEVKQRDWKAHIPPSEVGHGITQPYCLVNLPDDAFGRVLDDDQQVGRIDIAPLFDVHLGNHGHRAEKFLGYIRWIAESPNMYAICGGDLMENALDDGRGMSYDQDRNPQTQMEEMIDMLAPIAHKILCMIPGNHEWRTYNKTGVDPMRFIADRLNIPYFDGPVYLSIVVGGKRFRIYVQHGTGNSQTKGGKMNSAGRPRKWLDFVHFILSGHVHDPVSNSETTIVEDVENCRLVYRQTWTVIAPSFLRWEGTYAYRAGYAPPGSGGVLIHLYENGTYRATQK
jgi:hypothetical protein